MLNNKGFTLVEVIACLVIISFISILVVSFSNYTLSINKEEAYKVMKNNISKASVNYLKECEIGQLDCDINWNNDETSFYVEKLKTGGYFKNLMSPIDGKDVGRCLVIKAFKNNGVINIEVEDNCY